ncbi:FACT complex subunit ssrp1, partial [Coemansia sp. RSA 2703]
LAKAYTQLSEIYSRIAGSNTTVVNVEPSSPAAKADVKRAVSKKIARDPNQPKRPMTSYLLYSTEKRQEFRKTYPDVTSQDMAVIIGNAWKNLSSEEREKYNARAKQLKKSYDVDMENYKQSDVSKNFKAPTLESSGDSGTSSEDDSVSAPATPPSAPANAKVAAKPKSKKIKTSSAPLSVAGASTTAAPVSAAPASEESAPKKKSRKHKSDAATNGSADVLSPSKKKSKKVSK